MTDTRSRVPVSLALESGTRDTCPGKRDSQRDSSGTQGPNSIAQQALAGIARGTSSGKPAGQTCPRGRQSRRAGWDSPVLKFGSWPRLMRAETAAAYCDEVSVEAFKRRVGTVYSRPVYVAGRGNVWLKAQLDRNIQKLNPEAADVMDAGQLL